MGYAAATLASRRPSKVEVMIMSEALMFDPLGEALHALQALLSMFRRHRRHRR